MIFRSLILFILILLSSINNVSGQQQINIDNTHTGRIYEGIGALSAGASTRLLMDYQELYCSQILDFLFKPKYGANKKGKLTLAYINHEQEKQSKKNKNF